MAALMCPVGASCEPLPSSHFCRHSVFSWPYWRHLRHMCRVSACFTKSSVGSLSSFWHLRIPACHSRILCSPSTVSFLNFALLSSHCFWASGERSFSFLSLSLFGKAFSPVFAFPFSFLWFFSFCRSCPSSSSRQE